MLILQEETNNFLKTIEEANKKMQAAEVSLEEKDQRIGELDRLIERMEKVKTQLLSIPLAQLPAFSTAPTAGLHEGLRCLQHDTSSPCNV